MASACTVLDCDVRLVASTGEKAGGGRLMRSFLDEWLNEESGDLELSCGWGRVAAGLALEPGCGSKSKEEEVKPKSLEDWMRGGAVRVVTDNLVDAPEISTLTLHLPAVPRDIVAQFESVSVRSTDQNLLVLYTWPKWDIYDSPGRYLVYDTAADSLFLAPRIDSDFRDIFGVRPVVIRRGEGSGDFILALVLKSIVTQQFSLFLWSPSTLEGKKQQWVRIGQKWVRKGQQWVRKDVCLPNVMLNFNFRVDVAFAFQGQWACWVDLRLGILTCDVLLPDPEFQLKLLPDGYVAKSNFTSALRGRPDGYSTVGCVDGKVKFLCMDGYRDYQDDIVPGDQVTITSWTLVGRFPKLSTWVRDDYATLRAGDLWADESFPATPGPPKLPPCIPVLSPKEPDVVYFFLNDIGEVDGRIATKDEYVLGLNLRSKKLQSWTKCPPGRSHQMFPYLIAADLCVHKEPSNLKDQVYAMHKHQKQY